MSRPPSERSNRIVELFLNGAEPSEIMEMTGASRNSVYAAFETAGFDLTDPGVMLSEAARELGIGPDALWRWLRHHNQMRHTKRVGKYRYVPRYVLERYARMTNRPNIERATCRPKGWVGIHRACADLNCSHSLIWKAALQGRVRAVRVGFTNYYNPEDLERLRRTFLNDTPLPGWVSVLDASEARGADAQATIGWLNRNGFETRKFTRPETRQRVVYAREEAVKAWEAYHAQFDKGRALTLDQARAIRERRAAGEKRNALAREYGVSEAAIRQIVLGKTYREPLAAD